MKTKYVWVSLGNAMKAKQSIMIVKLKANLKQLESKASQFKVDSDH